MKFKCYIFIFWIFCNHLVHYTASYFKVYILYSVVNLNRIHKMINVLVSNVPTLSQYYYYKSQLLQSLCCFKSEKLFSIRTIQASRVSVSFVVRKASGDKVSEHQVLNGSHIFVFFTWILLLFGQKYLLSTNICVKGYKLRRENNPIRLP